MLKMGPFAGERERAVQAQPQVLLTCARPPYMHGMPAPVVRYQARKGAAS
jgi:hypothetical protein